MCLYITFYVIWGVHIWKLILLGLPGQFAIFLWFRMFRPIHDT